MIKPVFTAVKLQTLNLAACESFFGLVFGFRVTHRYGGQADEPFEEIVMTESGEPGTMLKFVQSRDQPTCSTGATLQFVVDSIDEAIAKAQEAGATIVMEPTSYPEAGVRMAVIMTREGIDIELVQTL